MLPVENVPEPTFGEYQILCEMLYGATCAGTDGHLIAGHPPFCYWMNPPFILGHESTGRVIQVGAKVTTFKMGDLVTRVGCPAVGDVGCGWGGFAELGVATDWRAMKAAGRPESDYQGGLVNNLLPADFDPAAATMIITWCEPLSYLTRMGFAAGKSLLVFGSGGNGLAYAAHATNLGASTVTLVGSHRRAAEATRAGANTFIDYKADTLKQDAAAACPGGYDFVIDAIGRSEIADVGLALLKPGGSIGVYGLDGGGAIALNPGATKGTFTYYNGGYEESETHDRVVADIQAGKLDASIWLDLKNPFPLDAINDAFEAVNSRRLVKAVVKLS